MSTEASNIHWVFPGRFSESLVRSASPGNEEREGIGLRSTSKAQREWADNRSMALWTQGPSSVGKEPGEGAKGPLERSDALTVGTAIHLLMEQIACGTAEASPADLDACLAVAASNLSISKEARTRAGELLDNLRQGEILGHLRSVEVLATELPILMDAGSDGPVGAWSGSIDLLYRCPKTGEVVVVDHKTDRVGERDLQEIADHHAQQGRVYVDAVRRALSLEKPPRFEVWLIEADSRVVVE